MVQAIFITLLNVPEVKIVTTTLCFFVPAVYWSSSSGCDKFILTVGSIKSVSKWLLASTYVSSPFSVLHTYNHMTTVCVWYAFDSHYYMADWHILQGTFWTSVFSLFCPPVSFTIFVMSCYHWNSLLNLLLRITWEFATRFAESCSFCFTSSR